MKELNAFRQFLNESQQINEGTWSVGTPEQIQDVIAGLEAFIEKANLAMDPNNRGKGFVDGLKMALNNEAFDTRMYRVVGDDSFHDRIAAARREAAVGNFDAVVNELGDAIARAEEIKAYAIKQQDRFGENIEEGEEEVKEASTKMKKSELKEMIRAAFLQEATLQEAEEDEEEDEAEDIDLEDVEIEADVDVNTDSEGSKIDVKQDADTDLAGVEGEVQDNLEAALDKAKKLGDEKLVDQIGNTLTFFTRQHVVK